MGGKGQRRRVKNYKDAHGGSTRLPPPPDTSKLDALPSKLRKLISFYPLSQDSTKGLNDVNKKRKIGERADLESGPNEEVALKSTGVEDLNATLTQMNQDDIVKSSANEPKKKNKKKRKRNQVDDLHIKWATEKLGPSTKRRDHKKKYLEAKKNKRNKAKSEDALDIPRDNVVFGDIVQAPPKLVVVPKVSKKYAASQERVRLKAVEEYRQRRGWNARPGVHLPSLATPTT